MDNISHIVYFLEYDQEQRLFVNFQDLLSFLYLELQFDKPYKITKRLIKNG